MTTQVTKIRRTRAVTIVTPQAATVAATPAKTSPSLNSKPHTNLTRMHVTADALKDPQNAARILNQIQANTDQATVGARTNPTNAGGVVFKSQPFVSGVAKLYRHNLGRQPNGYQILRSTLPTASASYGELYNVAADAVTVSMTTAGTFYPLPMNHAGLTSGTTLTTGAVGKIAVTNAGIYHVSFVAGLNGGATTSEYTVAVFVNASTQIVKLTQDMLLPSTGSISTIALSGLLSLNAGDFVDMGFTSTVNADAISVDTCNLNLLASGSTAVTISETTLPPDLDSSIALNLVPSATCTADLMIF